MHNIIPPGEYVVKGTEELNKQVARELDIPDEPKHTTAQLFEEGEEIGSRRRNPTEDNKDSEGTSSKVHI
jgi:hypothetical protein